MRSIANVRLFMLRPESFLLHAGQVLEGASVSDESVQDAQRVSVRENLESIQTRGLIYQLKVSIAILEMGYDVIDLVDDFMFDLAVADDKGRQVNVKLKDHQSRKLPKNILEQLAIRSYHSVVPILLVSSTSLSSAAQEVLRKAKNLEAVIFRDEKDNPQLSEALQRLFNSIP